MRTIPLTQGKFAIVDDEDFERVNSRKWCACVKKSTNSVKVYALSAVRKPNGTKTLIKLHQFILGDRNIDHRNGNGLDNRRHNLRKATGSQNQANRRSFKAGFKGVYWNNIRRKWHSAVGIEGRPIDLGYWVNKRNAAIAYNVGAILFFGDFACLNDVDSGHVTHD